MKNDVVAVVETGIVVIEVAVVTGIVVIEVVVVTGIVVVEAVVVTTLAIGIDLIEVLDTVEDLAAVVHTTGGLDLDTYI